MEENIKKENLDEKQPQIEKEAPKDENIIENKIEANQPQEVANIELNQKEQNIEAEKPAQKVETEEKEQKDIKVEESNK